MANCGKKASFIIEWGFFLCYNYPSRLHKPWCHIETLGGGLNDELGFDCFDSYNHFVFDF